jgi:hypothetical protein
VALYGKERVRVRENREPAYFNFTLQYIHTHIHYNAMAWCVMRMRTVHTTMIPWCMMHSVLVSLCR